MLHDGENYCQFDAFNRLIQVNNIGSAQIDPATGRVVSGQLGDFIARYAYDGLGRLIRKQTPVSAGQTYLQTKDYYYDDSRRIQEVILRPDVNLAGLLVSGKVNPELVALFDVDGDGVPDVEQSSRAGHQPAFASLFRRTRHAAFGRVGPAGPRGGRGGRHSGRGAGLHPRG